MKEALERAEALKKRANTVLVDTRYPEAVEQYTLAIKVRMILCAVYWYCASTGKRIRGRKKARDRERARRPPSLIMFVPVDAGMK